MNVIVVCVWLTSGCEFVEKKRGYRREVVGRGRVF